MKKLINISIVFLAYASTSAVTISHDDALRIGKKIWKNECKGSVDGLTSWNEGEEFASLGIGHFIWCHDSHKKSCPFSETFPSLLSFIQAQGTPLPKWLTPAMACPWKSRDSFLKEFKSPRMKELRTFLLNTIDLQTTFIVQRVEGSLPKMLKGSRGKKRAHIKKQFSLLEQSPAGIYALIDYVNFKGEGTNKKEFYAGAGWGLLQVLERMKATDKKNAVVEFATNAKIVLTERVKHSPPARNEIRWLPGWKNRINTYLSFT